MTFYTQNALASEQNRIFALVKNNLEPRAAGKV